MREEAQSDQSRGKQKTAIMGFGNPCRSDDAIGIYVIERLQEHLGDREELSILDMGTSAFEVLFQLKGHKKLILIDAVVNSGEKPGTLFKVPAKELEAAIIDDPMVFLHGLKWDQALSYAKKILGTDYPEDIEAYLIAIDDIRIEVSLSKEVKSAGDHLAETLLEHLKAEVLKEW